MRKLGKRLESAGNPLAHTKEPWSHREATILGSDGFVIAYLYSKLRRAENIRRIVACVNACADIPSELLAENGPAYILRKQRDALQAKCDALQAELARLQHREAP